MDWITTILRVMLEFNGCYGKYSCGSAGYQGY